MNGNATGLRIVVLGGEDPEGTADVLAQFDADAALAIVVMSDAGDLVDVLRQRAKLPVALVDTTTQLQRSRVYVVPRQFDVMARGTELVITDATPGGRFDRLLRTLADTHGAHTIAVILGGSGIDGAIGIRRLKESGGIAFAEQPPDGPFGEMARSAIATGMVDQIVPRAELADRIVKLARVPEADVEQETAADMLRDILSLVRIRSGHDFSAYKQATMYRRVARRMQVNQTPSIGEYHRYLRDHPAELSHLLRDFLISVTNFFRDPEAFAALAQQVIPKLFNDRGPGDRVRAWVAGCATGEEAYSLGILLLEHARRLPAPPQIQIFATDIDEEALAEARHGRYPETIAADVSRERLDHYFVREGAQYRVGKELRELVLFSPHNVLRDPPFSRLDLVTCRNLMIYLNREAQNRVLSAFHFGLRPYGAMFLGSSESVESSTMFAPIDPRFRMFSRRAVPSPIATEPVLVSTRWAPTTPLQAPPLQTERTGTIGELHHRLVEHYAPPSILINGDLDVVHVSEHAGRYLEVAGGEPTHNILRLILPELSLDLRSAIYAARQRIGTDVRRIAIDKDGQQRTIELRVRSLDLPELGPHAALIWFDEIEARDSSAVTSATPASIEPVVREMEDELHRTREQLRSTVEQYETSLEELKASNEELQAINEELRSASEELETSKEELQSVNEELTTLNHELKVKVDEVSHANSDLQNLMTSTDIGVVFLDRFLNIHRFTPRARDVFNLIASDVGRPLAHLTHRLDTDAVPELAKHVLETLRTVERDVTSRDGRRYLLRLLPYRSLEDRIDGVVLTFVDVTDLRDAVEARRRSEVALLESEARLALALRDAPVMVLRMNEGGAVTWGSLLGRHVPAGAVDGLGLFSVEQAAQLVAMAAEVRRSGVGRRTELAVRTEHATRTYDFRIEPAEGGTSAVGFDITPSKRAEAQLLEADRTKDQLLATLAHELRDPFAPVTSAIDAARVARDPAALARAHEIMERQIAAIRELVDEVLDLSRLAQGTVEIVTLPVAPAKIVEAALEATRAAVDAQNHELTVELSPSSVLVRGDLGRLVQVLTNLVRNAAKHTPAGGKLALRVRTDDARKTVTFEVEDNGIGIPAEVLPKVFDGGIRDAATRARGGLGIGLDLVRRLVELHGGTVGASSDGLDRGSKFTVELPAMQD